MKVTDYSGRSITNIDEWRDAFFQDQKKIHWKEGRSAYEIANFIMNGNGCQWITDVVSKVIGESVVLDKAIPEWEVRFDEFGHGREHDLGIWGKAGSKSIFIGIESKVDETFGATVADRYIVAKTDELNGVSTKATIRIEKLMKRNFSKIELSHFNLRYQLLYATTGTVAETADVSVLLIIVFKTEDYNSLIGSNNHKDYVKFLDAVRAEQIGGLANVESHKLTIDGKTLYSIYCTI